MNRTAELSRKTKETDIRIKINLDGSGLPDIATSIPFFDHMLTLFTVHGRFDLTVRAVGDTDVDFHHTVEDTGIVLGKVFNDALGDRKQICRYGGESVPMDEALSRVDIDLSNRPYFVYNIPGNIKSVGSFDAYLAKEFFRAFSVNGGLNLHINACYGENEHHILESIFKAAGRALKKACSIDSTLSGTLSSKGTL